MAEIKAEEMSHDEHLLVPEETASTQSLPAKRRLASLDIFRGLTVAVSFFSLLVRISNLDIWTCTENFRLVSGAVDDPRGWRRRRLAGDCARSLGRLQFGGFRHAFLFVHRRRLHRAFLQGFLATHFHFHFKFCFNSVSNLIALIISLLLNRNPITHLFWPQPCT